MAAIKLFEQYAVEQLRRDVRDSLLMAGEECILMTLYRIGVDKDAERCPDCFDDFYQDGDGECTICYGTGITGGVKQARRVWALFTDNTQNENYTKRGEWAPDKREIQTEAFPMLMEHDIIVRVRRWSASHEPLELEGFYSIQGVTQTSLRTGNRFGQYGWDVVGQRGVITELSRNLPIARYPILGETIPQATAADVNVPAVTTPNPQIFTPSGSGGSVRAQAYTFVQSIPADTWTITHDFDHLPSVTVVVNGEQVTADVTYPQYPGNPSPVVVSFAIPKTGVAVLL